MTARIERFRRPDRPLVYGHRGVREGAPENTLAAFEVSADQGADGIELDVRACATGEIVVFHDPDLSRMTDERDGRAVAALSWSELREVEVGQGQRVPLLTEVLAFARSRRLRVNVEMKRDAPSRTAIVNGVAGLLGVWDARHPILVSSFDPWMLSAFAGLCPRPARGLLVHESWYDPFARRVARTLGADAIHVERTLSRPRWIETWKRRLLVNVWTVNDPREARDLARLGVDGIITDRPAAILEAIRG